MRTVLLAVAIGAVGWFLFFRREHGAGKLTASSGPNQDDSAERNPSQLDTRLNALVESLRPSVLYEGLTEVLAADAAAVKIPDATPARLARPTA
jgi:hypothetical protein